MRHASALFTKSCIALALLGGLTDCKKKPPKPPPAAVGEGAIVIHNMTGLESDFSFEKTIGQILKTANIPDDQQHREDLVKTMVLSFNSTQLTNPLSSLPMAMTPRGSDAGIPASDLLNPASANGLKPIGLFNRLDLAPADWSDCGEHRIVYSGGSRIFLIFEAKLPNPNPAAGKQGCRAVAQRWADISTAPAAQKLSLLKEFYFTGLPGGFRPVVHYLNYGSFLGQVRTNILGQGPWQLREFRVLPVAPGHLAFNPGPVASNPLLSFYRDNPIGSSLEQSERAHFQAKFAAEYLNNLRNIDETEPASVTDDQFKRRLMNALGGGFEARSNEFQSQSQLPVDTPSTAKGGTITAPVPATWTSPVANRTISQDELFNRATATTCAGCHGLASGKVIGHVNGNEIKWPKVVDPDGFVHISQNADPSGDHKLSEALTAFFIPFRQEVTNDILNTTTAMIQPAGRLTTAVAALFIPQARAQPAQQARPAQGAAPTREQAESAATELVLGRVAIPESADAAGEVRRNSDLAHAEEQVTPGAYVKFRRPH